MIGLPGGICLTSFQENTILSLPSHPLEKVHNNDREPPHLLKVKIFLAGPPDAYKADGTWKS